jgi:hypothetical protein
MNENAAWSERFMRKPPFWATFVSAAADCAWSALMPSAASSLRSLREGVGVVDMAAGEAKAGLQRKVRGR